MKLKEILEYILRILLLIFAALSSTAAVLGVTTKMLTALSHEQKPQSKTKKKNIANRLCCLVLRCRKADKDDENGDQEDFYRNRVDVDYGLKDKGTKVVVSCCSRTRTTSCRDYNYRFNDENL